MVELARQELLTSAEVAARLGVTSATVKRWADRGVLRCIRTAGRHRRFRAEDVERMGESLRGGGDPVDAWIDRMLSDPDRAFHAALLAEHARVGAWWRVAEDLGPVLERIGERWDAGTLAIRQEHAATARVTRGLARACEGLRLREGAPRALLASAEGDLHSVGLSLVEPCVREMGWPAVWLGAPTPASEVVAAIERREGDVVLLSASPASSAEALAVELERVAPACAEAGTPLVIGGSGPWPGDTRGALLFRSFRPFRAWLEEYDAAWRRDGPQRVGARPKHAAT